MNFTSDVSVCNVSKLLKTDDFLKFLRVFSLAQDGSQSQTTKFWTFSRMLTNGIVGHIL